MVEEVLPIIKEYQHPQFGILLLLDTEMVEAMELEELHGALMELKVQVDAYNRQENTDHFIMVGLCTYYKDSRHRYSDARVKSVNAVFCAFN